MARSVPARIPIGTPNSWVYVQVPDPEPDEALWSEGIVLEVLTDVPDAAGYWDALILDPDGNQVLFDLRVPPLLAIRLGNGEHLPEGLGVRQGQPVYRCAKPDIPRGARFREI